jgi:hypothetical protein
MNKGNGGDEISSTTTTVHGTSMGSPTGNNTTTTTTTMGLGQVNVVEIDLPPLPAELQKYATRMCLLSNVNKEATREDILELFRDFGPVEETLKIRHDDAGEPTGDAIVACVSQASSRAAVRTLNGHRFMGQHIKALLIAPPPTSSQ